MDITIEKMDVYYASIRVAWDAEVLARIKTTLGRQYHASGKFWSIPIDQVIEYAKREQQRGHRVIAPATFQRELSERQRMTQAFANTMFRDNIDEFVTPSTIVTEPRPYQAVAATAMGLIPGGMLLADPVGVGKTLEAILDHELNGYRQGANSILWIVPSTLRRNIRNQYKRHMGLTDDEVDELVTVIGDVSVPKRKKQWLEPTDIKIVGYEMYLRYDWNKPHVPREWNKIYADEVTKIKNRKSHANVNLRKVVATHGITGMTATPLETKLEDVFQIMDVLRPGVFGNYFQFADEYLVRNKFGIVVGANRDSVGKFSEQLAPYMVKRSKEKLMPWLPPKVPIDITVSMPPDERKLYENIANNFTQWVRERQGKDASTDALVKLLRLRQFADSPNIVDPTSMVVGEKMRALFDIMECHKDDSVIIFSQWAQAAERIAEELSAQGYPVEFAKGGTDYFPITERINNGEHIVLVTTDAGAYGLDMYGAHVIVHYDPLWNPAKMEEQREGRLHRGDQKEPVLVYTLIVEDTFECVTLEVERWRSQLASAVYDGAEMSMLSKWSADDWEMAVHGRLPEGTWS